MSDHKINVKVNLDDNEAQKKLNDLTKKERKIDINVDTSDIDQASKKVDGLKNKDVKVDAKVTGKETIDSTAKSLDKATKNASGFSNTIKGFAKFGAYLQGFQLLTQVTQEALQAIKEIDAAIVDLQVASGESYETVRQMVSGYNEMAKSIGATTTEVTSAADTWLRQGKSLSEANELIQQSMVLSKLGEIDSDDASTYLTAMINGFHVATDEVSSLNDALTAIDMSAAVDAGGLAEATSRVAASADLAGVSLERLLGYEAAIGEASQESMSVVGNSLKTILTRLSSIKAGNLELVDEDGTTQTLSDVEAVFDNIGVPLRNSMNEFRNFGDVLDEVAAKWSSLSSVQKSAVSQVAAGTFQANRFKLLMENYDKALEYEQIALDSSGTAAAKFEDTYLNSIEAKTKSLQAAFEGLSSNLISRDTINGILEATQALVEFLDKTNLVKGALAGIAVGGALKGFSLISAGIVKATADITSFGDAAKKAFSALKANPIGVISTVVGLATAAWSSYNQAIEESIQKAKDITSAWDESNTSLNEQISKYKELKSQLDSGTLTPDEEYSTRQQILDIQTQITNQYGEQVEGVNLVNGSLEQQLALLQQIASENALTELNKNMDSYKNVAQQMEKERSYQIGAASFINDNAAAKDIYNLAKEYEDLGITLKDVSDLSGLEDGTSFEIYFDGDATQADKVISDFMNRVSELKKKYQDDVGSISFIDDSNYYASDALKKNQEILDDYQESYNKFLQMDMISRGTEEGSVADTYYKYADAVSAYNEALASGDNDAIAETRSEFQALNQEVDNVLSQGDNDKFTSLFDEVGDSLNEASIKLNDFNEALAGKAGNSNAFKETADDIKAASDELKEMKLDAQEVRDALITDGAQTGEDQILALADAWGLTEESIKNQDEAFTEFLSILQEAGIITGEVASATDTATASYDAFSSTVQTATENLSTLQSIMSESVSGSGISAENVQAFRDMFGDDAEKALEKTANGYHLNKEALAELQAQQETLTKSDYLSALSDQYELLAENSEKLAKAQFMGDTDDITALEATRQGIMDQISSLQDLQYQYESATSAYQDWINAQSNGNERDMYDNIQSGYATVTDLIERGWGGSDEVRTYVDLLSSADLSTASVDEVIDAYNRLGQTIGSSGYSILDFFTVDEDGNTTTDGIYNFFDTVNSVLGEEFAKINENGDYEFNFGDGRDQTVAERLGMDVESVQSILRAASEAGFEINLDQPIESLEELKTSAQSAQEALANMQDSSLADINLDSTSFSEITDDIAQVEDYIDKINDDKTLDPDVKTEKLENANAILEYLVEIQNEAGNNSIEISVNSAELERKISDAKAALDDFKNDDGQVDLSVEGAQEAVDNLQTLLSQKEQLNTPTVMAVDTSQVDGELGNAIAKIQEYQNAVQDLAVQTELKAQGVDIDTSAAQEKVNNLAAEIQGLNPDITAKLNIDTSSTASLQSTIQAITPEILVKAGVDETAIVNYTPGDKDASVKYKVDSSAVDTWKAPNKNATLTYTITTTGTLPGNKTRTLTYNIETNGNAPHQGTAHANGSTAKSYRFNWNGQANASGNWGIKKGSTSLVGELGQEILVRGSKFYTIGDNGAEFIQTRPGDIIFNHKQAESLLKNGYVTSRGKMIGGNANVNGSAYSSGSGGLGRPSRPSYGMDDSYASNNSSQKSSAEKSADKASKSAEKAADKFEEIVDSIETLLDRMDRNIQKLTDSIETYSYDLSKQSAASDKAMSTIRSNLTTLQSAYNRYIKEANSVGLSDSWKKRVQNGAIDITTVNNEDLADQISKYQDWWKISRQCKIFLMLGTP
jgi:TP901 family phage tail tape measure protein